MSVRTRLVTLLVLMISCLPSEAMAQFGIDGALHGDRLDKSRFYGAGASLILSFGDYAFEFIPSATYYFTPVDSTDTWSRSIEARANLFVLPFIRPYVGAGYARVVNEDVAQNSAMLTAGTYVNVWPGDRLFPFVEATYRAAGALEDWRFRLGIRVMFREQ